MLFSINWNWENFSIILIECKLAAKDRPKSCASCNFFDTEASRDILSICIYCADGFGMIYPSELISGCQDTSGN